MIGASLFLMARRERSEHSRTCPECEPGHERGLLSLLLHPPPLAVYHHRRASRQRETRCVRPFLRSPSCRKTLALAPRVRSTVHHLWAGWPLAQTIEHHTPQQGRRALWRRHPQRETADGTLGANRMNTCSRTAAFDSCLQEVTRHLGQPTDPFLHSPRTPSPPPARPSPPPPPETGGRRSKNSVQVISKGRRRG